MSQIELLFGFILLVFILLMLTGLRAKKRKTNQVSIFDQYSERGKVWMQELYAMYVSGLTWSKGNTERYESYEKKFGITLALNEFGVKVGSYWDDIGAPMSYNDAPEESMEYKKRNFLFWLETYLDLRYNYTFKPLRGKDQNAVFKETGIQFEADELLYLSEYKVDWYEQQVVATNVEYNGYKFRGGGAMSFQSGSFREVRNNVTGYVPLPRGNLFVTNKRVIFIAPGPAANRSIRLGEILELEAFKDGIILGVARGKKPLILFPPAINTLIQPDGLNPLLRVIHRLLEGTENQDLRPQELMK
jgi:hypothetical protein